MCKTIVCLPQGVVGFTVRQECCYSICNISVSRDVPQSITAHDQDIISPVFVLRDIVYLYLNKPLKRNPCVFRFKDGLRILDFGVLPCKGKAYI